LEEDGNKRRPESTVFCPIGLPALAGIYHSLSQVARSRVSEHASIFIMLWISFPIPVKLIAFIILDLSSKKLGSEFVSQYFLSASTIFCWWCLSLSRAFLCKGHSGRVPKNIQMIKSQHLPTFSTSDVKIPDQSNQGNSTLKAVSREVAERFRTVLSGICRFDRKKVPGKWSLFSRPGFEEKRIRPGNWLQG
jgi:hypothetical protein